MSPNPSRIVMLAAVLIVAGTGWIQGRWTGRWSPRRELGEIAARVDRIPQRIGTWQAHDRSLDPAELRRAGIEHAILRTYQDTQTGDSVQLLLVAGAPGPISVHTPDVCYEAAGFKMEGSPHRLSHLPDFFFAEFASTGVIPETLHIHWSWFVQGRWKAATSPRMSFAMEPALFKLYVVRTARSGEQPETGASARFLDEALPVIGSLLGDTEAGVARSFPRS